MPVAVLTTSDLLVERGRAVEEEDLALTARGVAKRFGATAALIDATIELGGGEVHAIVGENGSGKSTLVKILAGVHRPDAGMVTIRAGQEVKLRSPQAALRAGIATVFQEILVVEPRSILDNVWLGVEHVLRGQVRRSHKQQVATELLTQLVGEAPPLDLPVAGLSLSDRQACCIARALVREPQVLILDEATSALDYPTRERLFAMLREAARRGVGVIFISHRMDEIDELGDRITVMRSGRTVATLDRGCFDRETIVRLMTGEEPLTPARARTMHRHRSSVALTARRVVLAPGAAPIDLDIRSGEMLGVAGLEGHGQERFLRALAGHPPLAGETYRVRGERPERIGSPADAARLGIAYVPRERRSEGLFQSKSVRENFGMPTLARDAPRGIIHKDRTRKRLTSYQTLLRIKIDDAEASIARLSGGNQQKTLIARWLACQPRVLLLNDPTRGVDIAAKRDLYELLAELTAEGVAVVMLSSELDEHVELMDRVVVFHENAISAELQAGGVTRQSLVAAFFAMRERDA